MGTAVGALRFAVDLGMVSQMSGPADLTSVPAA